MSSAGGLDGAAYAECVAIIKTGGAVGVHYANKNFPLQGAWPLSAQATRLSG
jgi:hypothetical protein